LRGGCLPLFFPMGQKPPPPPPQCPQPPHYRGYTTTVRVTTLGRTSLDEWYAETSTWQHTKQTEGQTWPYMIRTRNPNKWTAADPRLRPCGHWDQHLRLMRSQNIDHSLYWTISSVCLIQYIPLHRIELGFLSIFLLVKTANYVITFHHPISSSLYCAQTSSDMTLFSERERSELTLTQKL